MKKTLLLLLLLLFSQLGNAQVYNAQTVKNVLINYYKEVPDSAIAYPIKGLFMVSQMMNYGYPMSTLEYFVLDAKGKLLYYNSYNLGNSQSIKDKQYARYMKLQGQYQRKIESRHS